jgi:inosine-uridine nucleoside N-ribohydrolase
MTTEHYHFGKEGDLAAGMEDSYNEFFRVMKMCHKEGAAPVYRGATTRIDEDAPYFRPVDTDSSRAIIKHVHEAGETVYIIATGPLTNVTSALLMDPTIKEKICVIWLGGNHLDIGAAGEFNFSQDPSAARYMMNTGVPMIWLPAMSNDATKGTQVLKTNKAFLDKAFPGEDDISRFFGGELVVEHDFSFKLIPDKWQHTFWDVAAPIVLEHPELCEFEIIETPRIRGDEVYNIEEGRPKAIILNRITDPQKALDYMAEGINTFAK